MIRHPKPVLLPRPSLPAPKRLERKPMMTVAVGLLATTGLVVASDSLESTITGYAKGNVQKVFVEPVPGGFLYFAGAGVPSPSDYVLQETLDALNTEKKWNVPKYVAKIRAIVKQYYEQYVWPSRQPSQFAALFGLWGGADEGVLLKTDQDVTVVRCPSSGCVGVGAKAAERAAEFLIGQLGRKRLVVASIDQLVTIAAYAVWVAKETIDGCGGPTQFGTWDKTHGRYAPQAIGLLENAFLEVERAEGRLKSRLFNYADDMNGCLQFFDMDVTHAVSLKKWREIQAERFAAEKLLKAKSAK
jgi:hypothetical protein